MKQHKYISDYVFIVGTGTISYRIGQHTCAAQSTSKGGYYWFFDATREAFHIRQMLGEI
jgi:hypothetical protein